MTVDFLFRYQTDEAFFAAMTALGVPTFPENEKPEEQLGAAAGYPQITHQGVIRRVRLWPEQVALIPDIVLSPDTILIDERSDEDNQDYEPVYSADSVDEYGVVTTVVVYPSRIGS